MTWRIAVSRRRPRRRSFCFRSLWWLIEREAAWQIVRALLAPGGGPLSRRGFAAQPRYRVRLMAWRMLARHPERRNAP